MTILNDISLVVDVLRNLSERGIKCNLLVGAGCSVSAGIPTAGGIIEKIGQKFPSAFAMVENKSYANCMNILSPDERMDLIKGMVNNAKLNITHIMIAQLLKGGYIHRILTPNFDNLLIKACSIINEYPPIYDLAAYEEFKPEHIPEKCIFYLHGQFTGFKLMNTNEEVTEQARKLNALFHRLNERSVWIIVGYSGQNDALFKLLSEESVYSNRLFWVGHKDQDPHEELINNILKKDKYGFYIKGYDSDSFFWSLAKSLGESPPMFLLRPFSYIKDIMEQIVPYHTSENCNLNKPIIDVVQTAINQYETDFKFMAQCYCNAGLYDAVIDMEKDLLEEGQKQLVSYAYFGKAYELQVEAEKRKSITLCNQVVIFYDKANELAESSASYNNSANCYFSLATFDTDNMEEHVEESCKRYLLALEFENEYSYAYKNFIRATLVIIKNRIKNKKVLDNIEKMFDSVIDSGEQKKYIDYINEILNNLAKIKLSDKSKLEQYLRKFMHYVKENIREIA